MDRTWLIAFMVLCGILAGCGGKKEVPAAGSEVRPGPPARIGGSGKILCRVRFEGDAPKPTLIRMDADKRCLALHPTTARSQEALVSDQHMLQNVFVYVKEGVPPGRYPTPGAPVVVEQAGCMYSPRVFGIRVGQTLQITNADPTLHNIHVLPLLNEQFNVAQPKQGMRTERSFAKPEIMIRVKCDVHSWMSAYIGVLDHPFFAVTDAKGACEIRNLPPGDYVLAAWHEKFGERTTNVSVRDSTTVAVSFSFAPR